jgi:hypothetical protein
MHSWGVRLVARLLVTSTVAAAIAVVSCPPMQASAAKARSSAATLAGRVFTVAGALRWTGPRDESRFATAAALQEPLPAPLPDGGFLVADSNQVLRVWPSGRFSVVAGGGQNERLGDGGPATSVTLDDPQGIAPLPRGGFLIADTFNGRVRRVWPDGHISTVAGNGKPRPLGDGGRATSASLDYPSGIAVLPDGGFLIADTDHNRVRRVWPNGRISTVAGDGKDGFSGDGGPATRAKLGEPQAVAVMPHGGFLIADTFNYRVRRVWPDGHISTVAGNGQDEPSGDGGPARSAGVDFVSSVATMPDGGILIGTGDGVRRVWPDGHISSVFRCCGGLPGDGGPAAGAQLYGPQTPSVAAMSSDGGMLIGYGTTVREVLGSHAPRLLAAAIRPLAGLASRHTYQPAIVLTKPANVTVRVYGRPGGKPLVTAQAFEPAGESTLRLRLGDLAPGLYGVDLRARSGSQVARAEQWVYLGGSVTDRSVRAVVNGILQDELSSDPNAFVVLGSCHRFSRSRVDCPITGDFGDFVVASFLSPHGQFRSRAYGLRREDHQTLFELHPRWIGPAIWSDLGGAWDPGAGQEY